MTWNMGPEKMRGQDESEGGDKGSKVGVEKEKDQARK